MLCHFIGDYTHFSTKTMLDAKRIGSPVWPILTHALVHASLMLILLSLYGGSNAVLAICFSIELLSHWVIDILKGKTNVWMPVFANPANKEHWYLFGFDQLCHQLMIIVIWVIITCK